MNPYQPHIADTYTYICAKHGETGGVRRAREPTSMKEQTWSLG